MNVEDSYEGAVRRLQRLEMAGIAIDPPASAERMRELEELATLACEDNERLKAEFGVALQELDDSRRENEQLRAHVASLEQSLASARQQPAFAPPQQQQAFAPSVFVSPFGTEPPPEEDYGYPPKSSGKGAKYFFVIAIAGAAIAALCVMRPWERSRPLPVVVEQPAPPPPVVTAPPPVVTAPKVEPTVPKLAPVIPKAAPVVTAPPRATKARADRKHAKHHAAKKHASAAKAHADGPSDTDDPLGGTGL